MSLITETPLLTRAEVWRELGQQLRVDAIRATAVSGSGHPTSAMSAADLIAVLAEKYLRYDFDHPDHPNNDHLIFSKGHASPLLYALYKAAGAISDEELLTTRTLGSPLEGHPSAALPWVDVATGSLGFGLPVGVGIALAAKTVDARPYRVWVLAGDSEMAEGSVWEALEHAAHWQLDNLTVILDVNRLGQSGETMHGWDLDSYLDRARSFGWAAFPVDGHDVEAIDEAYTLATAASERPSLIVARTVKGKGVAAVENQPGWHGKVLPDTEAAIVELGGMREIHIAPSLPPDGPPRRHYEAAPVTLPAYELGTMKATRRAYGEALATLGDARDDVVTMDGEVSNSTFSGLFAERHPERFFEMFVAEQQMIAAAIGFGVRGLTPFAPPSRPSSAAPTTSSAWARSAAPRSGSPARTPVWRPARTGRRRWRSRTSPCSARSTAAPSFTPATPTRPRSWSRSRPTTPASPTCARRERTRPSSIAPGRSSRSAAAGSCTLRCTTRSRLRPPGSPSTKRWRRRCNWRRRGSTPACSTSTRSSRSTAKRCSTRSGRRAAGSSPSRITGHRVVSATRSSRRSQTRACRCRS